MSNARTESKLFRSIRPFLPGRWNRIETKTLNGFPDTIGTMYGHTYAIELKIDHQTKPDLSANQAKWLDEWWAAGGSCGVLWSPKPSCYRLLNGKDIVESWVQNRWDFVEFNDREKMAEFILTTLTNFSNHAKTPPSNERNVSTW